MSVYIYMCYWFAASVIDIGLRHLTYMHIYIYIYIYIDLLHQVYAYVGLLVVCMKKKTIYIAALYSSSNICIHLHVCYRYMY